MMTLRLHSWRMGFLLMLLGGLAGGIFQELHAFELRSIDGRGNNLENPEWGSAGIQLLRQTEPCLSRWNL